MDVYCIAVTCSSLSSCLAVKAELDILQKKGFIHKDFTLLTIEDPADKIGSGGATLNALLVIAEYFSAQKNFMVVTSDVLHNAKILILHNGRDYQYNPCGKAFITLPIERTSTMENAFLKFGGIFSNLEYLLQNIEKLWENSPPGVWVCSTDMILLHKSNVDFDVNWENKCDAIMFCTFANIHYATSHGAVDIDSQGNVKEILYCSDIESIRKFSNAEESVPIVSGIVYLSVPVAESLLTLHSLSPLDCCTYMGIDSGAEPIQVSLFFDILIAMVSGVSKEAFCSGKCGKSYNIKAGFSTNKIKETVRARTLVWNELSRYTLKGAILKDYKHMYWSEQCPIQTHMQILKAISFNKTMIHSVLQVKQSSVENRELQINSLISASNLCIIGSSSVISNSFLECEKINIGRECFISGLNFSTSSNLSIPDAIAVVGFHNVRFYDNNWEQIIAVFGITDDPLIPYSDCNSTFCNTSWSQFFLNTGISPDDLWNKMLPMENRNLMNAQLFPCYCTENIWLNLAFHATEQKFQLEKWKTSKRVNLLELVNNLNHNTEFSNCRDLYARIAAFKVNDILCFNKNISLLQYIGTSCAEGWHFKLLQTMDTVISRNQETEIVARTLSSVADLLGAMAGKTGGLRSGPGGNKAWLPSFKLLKLGKILEGIDSLKNERNKWLERPDYLIRAARHYEGAVQILVQKAVESVKQFISFSLLNLPPVGAWVTAECPCRIDFQGGWTDTPPICYELGGSVVNASVSIDGKNPIGAKACRNEKLELVFHIGNDALAQELVINDFNDLMDYNQPYAQGALLKAAVICANLFNTESTMSMKDQLQEKYKGGFEIYTWSLLPQGSGLGTSSILAGAIIAVLWAVTGKSYDKHSILHAVLYLEQLLTTGGGWQDQVGGIIGGINRGSSNKLPVHIQVEPVYFPDNFHNVLNDHLMLLYTGKVRLAKNLLTNVIRNWYARDDTVVKCFKDLLQLSLDSVKAFEKGDLENIGALMNKYWEQKKILAPGCEPLIVKDLMKLLAPHCYGMMLAGAGGGGFMCLLTKKPKCKEALEHLIHSTKGMEKITLHTVMINFTGLLVTIDH